MTAREELARKIDPVAWAEDILWAQRGYAREDALLSADRILAAGYRRCHGLQKINLESGQPIDSTHFECCRKLKP